MAFTYYSPFTVQAGQVPSTQTDFAVLIKPTDARFKTTGNGGNVLNSSGYDIRPYADAALTSALTFELVPGTYSATTGTFDMWVKVPSLDDGYVIYMAYGNSGISTDGSSTATWASKYRGVWHMGDGTSISLLDSTGNANNATVNNGVTAAAGPLESGSGEFVRASGDYITVPDHATLDLGTGQIAVSCWVKRKSIGIFGGQLSKIDGADVTGWNFVTTNANQWVFSCINSSAVDIAISTTAPVSTTTWFYVVGFRNGTNLKVYENAVDVTTGTVTDNARNVDNAQVLAFAPYRSGALGSNLIDAFMTEMRVASTAPTANQITTEYNNQKPSSTFTALGTEVPVVAPSAKGAFYYYGGI